MCVCERQVELSKGVESAAAVGANWQRVTGSLISVTLSIALRRSLKCRQPVRRQANRLAEPETDNNEINKQMNAYNMSVYVFVSVYSLSIYICILHECANVYLHLYM